MKAINDANVVAGKRERKPKDMFLPENYQPVRKPRNGNDAPRRNRNEAADTTKLNRWDNYRLLVKRALVNLTKELHYVDVYTQQQKANIDPRDTQMARFNSKILQYKQVIYSTLAALDGENSEHKQWPELADADENDMVDVDNVYCSVCNLEESDNNDILFCDRTDCLRAYHQLCLDPPVTLASFDPDQDWFCWKCECMDDCLEVLGEKLDCDVNSYTELFPELKAELKTGDTLFSSELADDEDNEEEVQDDEFEPVEEERDDDELSLFAGSDDNDDENEAEGGRDAAASDEEEGNEEDDDEDGDETLLHQLQTLREDTASANEYADGEGEVEGDGEALSDLDSDLDEDEITHLLQEADTDAIAIDDNHNGSSRYKLRDRSSQKKALTIDDMMVHRSEADIGRPIAIIRRGVFILGTISHYNPEAQAWTLSYSSDYYKYKDNVTTEVMTVQQALLRYHEYETLQAQLAQRNAMQYKISALVQQSGVLSVDNILTAGSNRRKEAVDYVQLSMQMFGSLIDEDDVGVEDDDYHDHMPQNKNSSSSRRQSRAAIAKADSDDEEEDEQEEEEVSEEEYDPRSDSANNNKRKRGRPSKSSSNSSRSPAKKGRRGRPAGRPRKTTKADSDDGDEVSDGDKESGDDQSDDEVSSNSGGRKKKARHSSNGHDNNGKRKNPLRISRTPIKSYAPPSSSEDENEQEEEEDEDQAEGEAGEVNEDGVGEVELVVFDEDEEDMDVVQEDNNSSL